MLWITVDIPIADRNLLTHIPVWQTSARKGVEGHPQIHTPLTLDEGRDNSEGNETGIDYAQTIIAMIRMRKEQPVVPVTAVSA